MNLRLTLLAAALLVTTGGCADDEPAADTSVAASSRTTLLWKRDHALEGDLARALELPPEELCLELGERSCIDEVHRSSLGGHDPFEQGLYVPLAAPLVTSPLALDRVVQAACAERIARDTLEAPVVFTALNLTGAAPAADDEAYAETVRTLYRRLLTRNPEPAELRALEALLEDEEGDRVDASTFALSACFAIGTTTEFVFL